MQRSFALEFVIHYLGESHNGFVEAVTAPGQSQVAD